MTTSDKASSRKRPKAPVVKFRPAADGVAKPSSNAKVAEVAPAGVNSAELARSKKMLKGVEEAIATLTGLRAALIFDIERLERKG